MDLVMYILVNEDIKISKGKLAGQVGHAVASYFYRHAVKPKDAENQVESDFLDEYMKIQKKIILKCPQSTLESLENAGILTIRDKGLTQLEPNTLTCVNFGIWDKEEAPSWIKGLKLYN